MCLGTLIITHDALCIFFTGELVVVCPSPGIVILRSASKPNHHIGVTNQKGAVKGNVRVILLVSKILSVGYSRIHLQFQPKVQQKFLITCSCRHFDYSVVVFLRAMKTNTVVETSEINQELGWN